MVTDYIAAFPIKNADGTSFNNLVLRKATVDSVVMSLGDKITGDVYYPNNNLVVTMSEYVEYDGVKYVLVNPPTIVREGMASDNGTAKGMTKYSFEFYHPMYMLGNFPFTDVAVTASEERYLSQNKSFSWIGTCNDFIAKLNANLEGTQWWVEASGNEESAAKMAELSDVLAFDNQTIADALKTAYETWEIPFVVSSMPSTHAQYANNKRFVITFGLPSNEIYEEDGVTPFIFQFGQGVGLKNNSRTPKNNKIITRLAGYGSEDNIPYGYPQIPWTGNQDWKFTLNNASGMQTITYQGQTIQAMSYPIYDGYIGGQPCKLIKHPFTRTHLMPSIYSQTVNAKVNPYAADYNPNGKIIDYIDAVDTEDIHYPNPINLEAPSFDTHEFEDVKPELGEAYIVACTPYNEPEKQASAKYSSVAAFLGTVLNAATTSRNENERAALLDLYNALNGGARTYTASNNGGAYTFDCKVTNNGSVMYAKYTSDNVNLDASVLYDPSGSAVWDDTMNGDGEYVQSYFTITLPVLSFDLYASASVTQEMKINMRSGACIGCTFPVNVDWEDYKKNFYDSDGNFAPDGEQRDLDKYPKSNLGQITVIVQKEIETFGTLMPNIYQQPAANDQFVFIGISMPTSYITAAEQRLDGDIRQYILDNNVYYYDYPLKFDEYFLTTRANILSQVHNNTIVRFLYAGTEMALYVKQITTKYGEKVLPTYDITLTDDVEIVLNQIGQVTDDVSRIRVQLSELQKYYSENILDELAKLLSKEVDDVAKGRITFQAGLDSIGTAIFSDELRSADYSGGLYTGHGWRIDQLGNAEFESAKVRSYLEIVELLVNRQQGQEGDTIFSDNDQVDKVDRYVDETDGSVTYVLSLKEKYDGYVTTQMYGNILKGIINTLAAKQAGISNLDDSDVVEKDGSNTYYTSWARVIATHNTDNTLGVNQIRVVLYGDDEVPAGKNFEPCQLMTISRWGCIDYAAADRASYEAEGLDTDAAITASIKRRQQVFYISTSEGRIVKLNGVDAPILRNGNYGTTLGELPDFVKAYPSVAERLVEGGDYLYAQGVVVGDFIKIDKEGLPVATVVFCGDWIDGGDESITPEVCAGIYYYNKFNDDTQQFETHEVRHNGGRWQCLQSQPVISGGVATYYEPKWNSPYWQLVDGNDNLTIEFVSTNGYSFYQGHVNTTITPHLFFGNVDISEDVALQYWSWERETESGKTSADTTWDSQHTSQRVLTLTNAEMPTAWGRGNKAIFTCTVVLNDGKTTRIIQNQIIA